MIVAYSKPALTFEQQADLLISRGLIVKSRSYLIERLGAINYYRLTAYLFPFKETSSDNYITGTTFDAIYRRYTFDRRLRCVVFDAVERFETALKTRVVNTAALAYGPLGYLDMKNFDPRYHKQLTDLINTIRSDTKRSEGDEIFVQHFRGKYGNGDLPLWMVAEICTFSTVFKFFDCLTLAQKHEIASVFGTPLKTFQQWTLTLSSVRNICAHHGRLWNRRLGIKPVIPKKDPRWHGVRCDRLFAILLILRHFLKFCAPNSAWKLRVEQLIDEYSDLPMTAIGFPEDWKNHPLWK